MACKENEKAEKKDKKERKELSEMELDGLIEDEEED